LNLAVGVDKAILNSSDEFWGQHDSSGDREDSKEEIPSIQRDKKIKWLAISHEELRSEDNNDIEQ